MRPLRVLLTCSRSWRDWPRVCEVFAEVLAGDPDARLMHGDAEDGDRDCARIWVGLGGSDPIAWPARWEEECAPECRPGHRRVNRRGVEYCPTAGPRRNAAMVASGPDVVVAFVRGGSRGASGTVRLARAAGVECRVFPDR